MAERGLGIDISSHAVRLIELTKDRRRITVVKSSQIDLETDPLSASAGVAIAEKIQKGLRQASVKKRSALPAVPGKEGIFKYYYIPTTVRKNLKALFKIITTAGTPEGVVAGWRPISPLQGEIGSLLENQLYMVALCKNDILQKSLILLEKGKIQATRFTLRATGLQEIARHLKLSEGGEAVLLAELDRHEVNLVILMGKEMVFARAFSYSQGGFTERLKERFPEEEAYLAQAQSQVNLFNPGAGREAELCRSIALALTTELRQSIQNAQAQIKRKELRVEKIYLCGESSGLVGLPEYLSQEMGKPVEVIDPFDGLAVKPSKKGETIPNKRGLAVALGLALTDLSSKDAALLLTPPPVEQKEYFWAHTAYRYYAIGMALLTALVIYLGGTYSLNKVDRIHLQIDQQLQSARGKKEQLLGVAAGLEAVKKQLEQLTEGLHRPEPTLAILEELGRVTPPGIRLTSVEIRNVGSGFPFDQAQVVTLSGVLGDREATEIAFIDAVERYARAIEQAPGFIQRKIERTGEPEPIRPQGGGMAVANQPRAFQFQFQLAPRR
ncbi:MAG: pilus assembly protein PilM (plasmid) [Candidatus Manganitrophus sp.]|nr:MAG: pilus assembly protein PilM [Candidatus Manganitrophus sp.]